MLSLVNFRGAPVFGCYPQGTPPEIGVRRSSRNHSGLHRSFEPLTVSAQCSSVSLLRFHRTSSPRRPVAGPVRRLLVDTALDRLPNRFVPAEGRNWFPAEIGLERERAVLDVGGRLAEVTASVLSVEPPLERRPIHVFTRVLTKLFRVLRRDDEVASTVRRRGRRRFPARSVPMLARNRTSLSPRCVRADCRKGLDAPEPSIRAMCLSCRRVNRSIKSAVSDRFPRDGRLVRFPESSPFLLGDPRLEIRPRPPEIDHELTVPN